MTQSFRERENAYHIIARGGQNSITELWQTGSEIGAKNA
jgi:hypothetical protein